MNRQDNACIIYPSGVYPESKPLNTIVELSTFSKEIGSAITEAQRDELVEYLAEHPTKGDEIPGTDGLRKLRWQSQSKGKRGGLRVIYFFYNHSAPLYLLAVYKKSDPENLSPKGEKTGARVHIPKHVDAQKIRLRLNLTQQAFAARYGFPLKTLKNWEQGIREPTGSARILLMLLDTEPKTIEKLILKASAEHMEVIVH